MSEFLASSAERSRIFRAIAEAILAKNFDKTMAETLSPWIEAATPADIARLVDGFVAEGLDFSRLKPLVSALLNLFRHPLEAHRYPAEPARERFLSSLVAEERAARRLLDALRPCVASLANPVPPTDPASPASEAQARAARNERTPEQLRGMDPHANEAAREAGAILERLCRIEILFRKKENILFPRFESRFPEYRCVRLMWSIQDDLRREIADFARLLSCLDHPSVRGEGSDDAHMLKVAAGRLFFDLSSLVFRDECVLYPLMASLFDEGELEEMYAEARDFGFAFLSEQEVAAYERHEPGHDSPDARTKAASGQPGGTGTATGQAATLAAMVFEHAKKPGIPSSSEVNLGSGSLSPEILSALFRTIPQDMTFVDEDDRVAFFTDGPKRVFPRSRSIIGRKVADCHPHESVDRVMRIVGGFRSGESDRESFWLTLKGRFIHIEYRALRTKEGEYLGTLEISEDLTGKRNLTGEKRL